MLSLEKLTRRLLEFQLWLGRDWLPCWILNFIGHPIPEVRVDRLIFLRDVFIDVVIKARELCFR